jgi:hypothetical protein
METKTYSRAELIGRIKGVLASLPGTLAPVMVKDKLNEAFKSEGIQVTACQARGPGRLRVSLNLPGQEDPVVVNVDGLK